MSDILKLVWNKIDWKKVESRIFRIQRRIYKAKTEKKVTALHYLQKKIINSLDGKLICIRESIKTTQLYWVKNIQIYSPKKNIILHYTRIKNSKTLQIKPIKNHQILIKDEAKQFLVKLALEPEWACKFERNSMGHNLGQSYQDTIENICIKSELGTKYVFHRKIFENFKKFNTKRFVKKLNTIKIIESQIEKWLHHDIMLQFENRKTNFFIEHNFETTQLFIIVNLLCEIAITGLEAYLTDFIKNTKTYLARNEQIEYCRYLDEILIVSKTANTLSQLVSLQEQYLNKIGVTYKVKKHKLPKTTEGINFLGFQLIILKKENGLKKKILISKESKKLLLAKTRFVIQKNKSVSSFDLINELYPIIFMWGTYFQYCDCSKDFLQLDHRILNQLRAWVFRRKAQGKNRRFLKEKYFPSERSFTYNNVNYKNNWVLCGEVKLTHKNNISNFLPKLSWIKKTNYVTVNNNYSIYNGDYLYWFKRLSNLNNEQSLLLKKKFLLEGKIEIYNLFTTINKNSFTK